MTRRPSPRPRLLSDDARRILLGYLTAALVVAMAATAPTALVLLITGAAPA